MYLDEAILRILYTIPVEVDITSEKKTYLMTCLQAGIEALIVFKLSNPSEYSEESFNEKANLLNSELEKEDPNIDLLMGFMRNLQENKNFNSLYESYLTEINKDIFEKAFQRQPQLQDEIVQYSKGVRDKAIKEYIETFVDVE